MIESVNVATASGSSLLETVVSSLASTTIENDELKLFGNIVNSHGRANNVISFIGMR